MKPVKLIIIKISAPCYRGKQATYNGEIIHPNGRHTVFAVILTGSSHDSWGGIPIELDIEHIEFLFPNEDRDIEDRTISNTKENTP